MQPHSGFADFRNRSHERMRRIDLVIPLRADEEEVPHFVLRAQMLEKNERRGIQPLEIIKE